MSEFFIDELFTVDTYTHSLAIFDEEVVKSKINADEDWWESYLNNELLETQAGLITLINLAVSYYSVRVTSGSLTKVEESFAREKAGPCAVVSKSGKVFIGKGECLPGGGNNNLRFGQVDEEESGRIILLPPGNYEILAYSIEDLDGDAKTELPDIVITIKSFSGIFKGLTTTPSLFYDTSSFLFPSEEQTKRKVPKLGLTLKAKVWQTARTPSGLTLKQEYFNGKYWPQSYKPYEIALEDMSLIKRGDVILIKTKHIDEDNKIIVAELLEIVGSIYE